VRRRTRRLAAAELHNMSVPPFSTLTLHRAPQAGRYFHASGALFPDAKSGPRRLASFKAALHAGHFLAALERRPTSLDDRAFRDAAEKELLRGDSERRLDDRLTAALAAANLPNRIGVFIDDVGQNPASMRPLPLDVSLGVLARRSGRLYLPLRSIRFSLVHPAWETVVLFFPDEVQPHGY
jgi:hypothetical protein